MASELEQLQRRFWRLITAPEGVEHALGEDPVGTTGASPVEAWIRRPTQGSAIERLDIYANMYFYRLLDTLRSDCPKLLALVGDRDFHNLVTDYLLAHPSEHPSLRHLSRHLAEFLLDHPLAERWPCASDLAALEWARAGAFDAPDAAVLPRARLALIAPEHWERMTLVFSPSLRVLELDYPVHELWRELETGEPPTLPERQPTTLRVWRQGWVVYHKPVSAAEAMALRAACGGAAFGAVCERIGEVTGEREVAPAAAALMGHWVCDGLLSAANIEAEACDGAAILEMIRA